ncbi:DinB family protein [Sporosarcina highlanderae]|uniref:DinB family protein n=1 Tax=Sporosarcina highlanderae TaxID=3035916 RepID=A0ABT8JMR8_9BACL|nr:DinB family protein [Sporosarcina highlanderae]MDN4606438.1 DinB family protein [Sporosarcina highlanderae]
MSKEVERNQYIETVLHQIHIAVKSTIEIMDKLDTRDLEIRPTENKFSIGQLIAHISLICKADLLISAEASEEEMRNFYSSNALHSIAEMKEALLSNFALLENRYLSYTEEELMQKMASYWGVYYTRFEWLLEISSHLYHHRGQLHAMLVHCVRKDPEVALFD